MKYLVMVNFILYFICITFPTLLLSKFITKSVTLTPLHNHISGIEVTTSNIDVITTSNKWDIDASSNNGWHLHISMNHSWNFLSNQPSTISFKTHINSTMTKAHKDIIFIFSQNGNKYITSTINIDSDNIKNGIYPHCSAINNDETVPMSNDNINTLLNDNNESNNREYKLTQGNNYDATPTNTVTPNISPYTIQLINNPINNWSKYIYTNQQCQFESFSTAVPIDIYISAADIGQVLSINKFEIIFQYNDTDIFSGPEETYSPTTTTIESNDNTKASSNSDSNILKLLKNTKLIIIILIAVTIILVITCICLILMVRMQQITNSKPKEKGREQLNGHKIDLEMASDLVLHVITFRNEETSKQYSFESNTSFGSQMTDYQKFDTNVAIANKNNEPQAIMKDNESEDDMEVIRDMIAKA